MQLETQTHTRTEQTWAWVTHRGSRLLYVHTCTVHANLGPWVPGPQVPGSTEYSGLGLHTEARDYRTYMHAACQFGSLDSGSSGPWSSGPRSPGPL